MPYRSRRRHVDKYTAAVTKVIAVTTVTPNDGQGGQGGLGGVQQTTISFAVPVPQGGQSDHVQLIYSAPLFSPTPQQPRLVTVASTMQGFRMSGTVVLSENGNNTGPLLQANPKTVDVQVVTFILEQGQQLSSAVSLSGTTDIWQPIFEPPKNLLLSAKGSTTGNQFGVAPFNFEASLGTKRRMEVGDELWVVVLATPMTLDTGVGGNQPGEPVYAALPIQLSMQTSWFLVQ